MPFSFFKISHGENGKFVNDGDVDGVDVCCNGRR